MTGSKRYFGYLDDSGRQWAVQLDESVYEQGILGFAQTVLPATLSEGRVLKVSSKVPLEARYVIAKRVNADSETVTRKFFVGSSATALWTGTGAGQTIVGDDGENYVVTFFSGEKRSIVPTTDTAITDGDVDNQIVGP